MLDRLLILVFSLLPSIYCFCQPINLSGQLLTADKKSPISYANIGILNTPIGTISNTDGTFELSIPDKYKNETILFAALGFERKSFSISELSDNEKLTVLLEEQTTILKNVTVKSRKAKPVVSAELGNHHYNEGTIYADSAAAGSAMALLMENRYPTFNSELRLPYQILAARLRIFNNTFDDFKIRIRFCAVDSLGLPGKDLIQESIIASSGMKKGWLKFDLAKHNIRIHDPSFFIVFEWLLVDEDRLLLLEQYKEFRRQFPKRVTVDTVEVDGSKISFNSWHGFNAGTLFGTSSSRFALENYKSYYRNNSYGKWKRSSFILTAGLTLANFD